MYTTFLNFVLLSLLITSQCFSETEQSLNQDTTELCNITLTTNKQIYSICEPIILSCTIRIQAPTTIYLNSSMKHLDFDLTVLDANKKIIPYTRMGNIEMNRNAKINPSPPKGILRTAIENNTLPATSFSTKSRPLNSGDTISLQFLLNRHFDLTMKGTHFAQVVVNCISDKVLGKPLHLLSVPHEFVIADDDHFIPIQSIKITSREM